MTQEIELRELVIELDHGNEKIINIFKNCYVEEIDEVTKMGNSYASDLDVDTEKGARSRRDLLGRARNKFLKLLISNTHTGKSYTFPNRAYKLCSEASKLYYAYQHFIREIKSNNGLSPNSAKKVTTKYHCLLDLLDRIVANMLAEGNNDQNFFLNLYQKFCLRISQSDLFTDPSLLQLARGHRVAFIDCVNGPKFNCILEKFSVFISQKTIVTEHLNSISELSIKLNKLIHSLQRRLIYELVDHHIYKSRYYIDDKNLQHTFVHLFDEYIELSDESVCLTVNQSQRLTDKIHEIVARHKHSLRSQLPMRRPSDQEREESGQKVHDLICTIHQSVLQVTALENIQKLVQLSGWILFINPIFSLHDFAEDVNQNVAMSMQSLAARNNQNMRKKLGGTQLHIYENQRPTDFESSIRVLSQRCMDLTNQKTRDRVISYAYDCLSIIANLQQRLKYNIVNPQFFRNFNVVNSRDISKPTLEDLIDDTAVPSSAVLMIEDVSDDKSQRETTENSVVNESASRNIKRIKISPVITNDEDTCVETREEKINIDHLMVCTDNLSTQEALCEKAVNKGDLSLLGAAANVYQNALFNEIDHIFHSGKGLLVRNPGLHEVTPSTWKSVTQHFSYHLSRCAHYLHQLANDQEATDRVNKFISLFKSTLHAAIRDSRVCECVVTKEEMAQRKIANENKERAEKDAQWRKTSYIWGAAFLTQVFQACGEVLIGPVSGIVDAGSRVTAGVASNMLLSTSATMLDNEICDKETTNEEISSVLKTSAAVGAVTQSITVGLSSISSHGATKNIEMQNTHCSFMQHDSSGRMNIVPDSDFGIIPIQSNDPHDNIKMPDVINNKELKSIDEEENSLLESLPQQSYEELREELLLFIRQGDHQSELRFDQIGLYHQVSALQEDKDFQRYKLEMNQ